VNNNSCLLGVCNFIYSLFEFIFNGGEITVSIRQLDSRPW